MYTVMIVEDDTTMREIIVRHLEKWRFRCRMAEDDRRIAQAFVKIRPHLILLDINLPVCDGFYWCREIRRLSKVPIIFISSRDTRMDKIMAMNMGGDDFITKPIDMDVLTAKIHALLRRTYAYSKEKSEIIEYHGAILKLQEHCLVYRSQEIDLTKNEFRILYELMKQAGAVVARDKIMRALWEDESFVDDNTLTVNVVRLRKKLAKAGLKTYITTKKGQGYRLS